MIKAIASALWKHKGTAFNVGVGAYSGVDAYQQARQEGSSKAGAVAGAAVEAALPMLLSFPAYMAVEAVKEAPQLFISGGEALHQKRRQVAMEQSNMAFSNAHFNDTQQTYTMRQRGMAIAQRSQYNTQQALLGNEAKYMMK